MLNKSYSFFWHTNPPGTAPGDTFPPDVDPTIFTSDRNLIDFVLAYQPLVQSECQKEYQSVFEQKIAAEGLQLEYEGLEQSEDGMTCFVKIHAPFDVLARVAEINRVKMPIQKSDIEEEGEEIESSMVKSSPLQEIFCCGKTPFLVEETIRAPKIPTYFTMEFTREHMDCFLNKDPNTLFPQAKRILLVWDILQRITVSSNEIVGTLMGGHRADQHVGIDYLIKNDVYVAAFPIHDGDMKPSLPNPDEGKPRFGWPLRAWLYECWARPGRWHCYQPLDEIKEYFGEKVAIYFAWLGMYTTMLFPITALGIICFIWGLVTMGTDKPSNDVCDDNGDGAWIMSLWGVTFLELWKRKQADLACKWDTLDIGYEYEPPRPEYQAAAKERKRHPITREWEPHIPARSKVQNIVASLSTVLCMLCLAIAVIVAVIIFKAIMVVPFYNYHLPFVDLLGSATVTSCIGSCINACCIIILERVYTIIAWWLTKKEYPRTMSSFETSYTYKLYTFQFINYYALLIYLAFVEPVVQAGMTPTASPLLNDRCDPVGCSFLVTQQLTVILILKQTWNNVVEVYLPKILNWWKMRKHIEKAEENIYTRYEKDFDLPAPAPLTVLPEYLEMTVQYGIVVLFGASFPLTPLFALINNIIEIRVDAYKFVAQVRRVVPLRAADIGSWYFILEFITKVAILTNALIIALTTDLIDRFIYTQFFSETNDLQGYNDFIMAEFNTKDWQDPQLAHDPQFGNVTMCRYRGYFNPPGAANPYSFSTAAWVTILAKIAFVLIFQNLITWIQEIVQYTIPDVPEDVELHIQRNQYISRVAAHKFEKERREKQETMEQKLSVAAEKLTEEPSGDDGLLI